MPIYEYVAEYCVESLYCPKRFAFRQSMNAYPVEACPRLWNGTEANSVVFFSGSSPGCAYGGPIGSVCGFTGPARHVKEHV